MAPEKAPAFQFYPKDFLSDPRVMRMSLEQRGAYITLICLCWTETSLPMDVESLSGLLHCKPDAFMKRIWPALQACFQQGDDGLLRQKRLDEERAKQASFRQSQKDRADKRWHRSGNATALPVPASPGNALPSSISHLPSAERTQEARAPIRMAPIIGKNPHLRHVFCDATFSYCVPPAVHAKLTSLIAPKHGGDHDLAGQALRGWYPTVTAKLVPGFVMGDEFKFWQGRFDAEFATPEAPKGQRMGESAEDLAAGMKEILQKRGLM